MSAVRLARLEDNSAGWHALRRQGIGGSDAAAILGLSPWTSRFTLWHEKRGEAESSIDPELAYWGHALEPLIIRRWRQEHPDWHSAHGQRFTWADPQRPYRHANPDYLASSRGVRAVIECKTVRYPDQWGTPGTDEVPVWYLCQVLHYLDVLGCGTAWIAALMGGNEYAEYVVHACDHRGDIELMRAEEDTFWASVQSGERPPIDGSDSTYQTIRASHPDIDDTTVDIDPDLAVSLLTTRTALDGAKKRHQEQLSTVADAMGTAHHAEANGIRVASRQARGQGKPFVTITRGATTHIHDIQETAA